MILLPNLCRGLAHRESLPVLLRTLQVRRSSRLMPRNRSRGSPAAQRFRSAVRYFPHPGKDNGLGEDAHFVSSCGRMVGVADGVGGWTDMGIDAGEYSRELMENAVRFMETTGSLEPKEALAFAYASATKDGTCTACLVSAMGDGSVNCCNLGDSGIMLLRRDEPHSLMNADAFTGQELISREPSTNRARPPGKWKVVFSTVEQTHYFNCPYQLGTSSRDRPTDAQQVTIPVAVGDILLTGTDGYFDNMFPSDTLRTIEDFEAKTLGLTEGTQDLDVEQLAESLALEAFRLANSDTGIVPFGANAKKHGFEFHGGKLDDLTLVVSILTGNPPVARTPSSSPSSSSSSSPDRDE